jgi:hypothetical protein
MKSKQRCTEALFSLAPLDGLRGHCAYKFGGWVSADSAG